MRFRKPVAAAAGVVAFKVGASGLSPAGANIVRPNGYSAIVSTWGEPCNQYANDGSALAIPWANGVPGGASLAVHKNYIPTYVDSAHYEVAASSGNGPWNNALWSYNCRKIGSSNKWSTHSWGIAIDVNSANNPQGQSSWNGVGSNGWNYGNVIPTAFKNQNFYWGINFSGSAADPMHFQYAEGY